MASADGVEETMPDAQEKIAEAEAKFADAKDKAEAIHARRQIVLARIVVFECRRLVLVNKRQQRRAESAAACDKKSTPVLHARLKKELIKGEQELLEAKKSLRRSITEYASVCSKNADGDAIDARQIFGVKDANLRALFRDGRYKPYKSFASCERLGLLCLTEEYHDEVIERGELKIAVVAIHEGRMHWFSRCCPEHGCAKLTFPLYEREDFTLRPSTVLYTSKERVQLPVQLVSVAREILNRSGRSAAVFKDDGLNLKVKVPLLHIRKILDTELFRMVFFNKTSDAHGIFPKDLLELLYEFVLEPYY